MLPSGSMGGTGMGNASGTITLDTSQLAQAVQTARGLAQQLNQAMNNAGSSAPRAVSGFNAVAASVRSVTTELTALSVASGLLTKIGLEGALSVRNYNLAFKQFVGTQKEAEAVTNSLIKKANLYGLEWEGVLQLGRALLPSLQGNTKELDGWISRAARLRSLFPTAPRGSETIAISEFLAGQNISLQRRFNIPASVIDEAASKFQDLGQQLDFILEKRGATEEAAVAMANSFVGVRNELTLLLAQGFTPLFQQLQPILATFREFITRLRETSPGLTSAGAGLIALTAAGAPALLLFNQLVVAAEKLKALGVLGGLGRLGVGGIAAGVGATAGVGIVNAIGSATGNERMQQFGLNEAWLTLRKLIVNIAFTFSEVDRFVRTGLLNALRTLVNAVIGAATSIGGVVSTIGGMLPARMGGNALSRIGADLSAGGGGLLASSNALFDSMITNLTRRNREAMKGFMNFMVPPAATGVGASGEGAGVTFTDSGPDVAGPVREWARAVARIEREAGEARLQATRDYEQQRGQTIAQYNLSALREAEDFARQRARQEANFQRQIAEFQADAARRERDMREDSAERIQEIEEGYARDRERAERDHRDRLFDAAARLDAVAVLNEQRQFQRQQDDAEDSYQERLQTEQENLAERLQAQRDADAERLADMRRAFEEQRAEEDIERAIRLQRQAEDHIRQLAEMDASHVERLAQINRQAAQERAALDESFIEQLNQAGVYRQAWLDQQKAQQEASLKLFNEFWKGFSAQFPDAAGPVQGPAPQAFPTSFADFGFPRSGPATGAAGGSVSNRAVTVAEGAIQVHAAPGQSETGIARAVRAELEQLLIEAGA